MNMHIYIYHINNSNYISPKWVPTHVVTNIKNSFASFVAFWIEGSKGNSFRAMEERTHSSATLMDGVDRLSGQAQPATPTRAKHETCRMLQTCQSTFGNEW